MNMSLSPHAASKKIHKINIWLSSNNDKVIKKILFELKTKKNRATKSALISSAIELATCSDLDDDFKSLMKNQDMLHKTTIYLQPHVIQSVFNIEQHFFDFKRITPSKIINAAIEVTLPSLEELDKGVSIDELEALLFI